MATKQTIVVAVLGGIVASGFALAAMPQPAAAQSRGIFGALFGFLGGSRDERFAPPTTNGYGSNSYAPFDRRDGDRPLDVLPPSASWGGQAYCVRLCDGRHFPLSAPVASSRAGAAQICSAMCPAARTAVFHGSSIDNAVAARGERYVDLDKAFLYRERIVADCTCNGRDAFGLAKIELAADPTLRAGDIVANGTGLAVFRGWRGDAHKAAAFTPIEDTSRVSAEIRRKLAGARVSRD